MIENKLWFVCVLKKRKWTQTITNWKIIPSDDCYCYYFSGAPCNPTLCISDTMYTAIRWLINTRCVSNRFIIIIYNKCWRFEAEEKSRQELLYNDSYQLWFGMNERKSIVGRRFGVPYDRVSIVLVKIKPIAWNHCCCWEAKMWTKKKKRATEIEDL